MYFSFFPPPVGTPTFLGGMQMLTPASALLHMKNIFDRAPLRYSVQTH